MNPATGKAVELPIRPGDVVEVCSPVNGRDWRLGGRVESVRHPLARVSGRWHPLTSLRRIAP